MTIRKILETNKDYIIKSTKEGKSNKQLGKEFDCNSGSIWYFLKDYNIQSKYKRSKNYGKKHELKNTVIDLFQNGYSVNKISKKINIADTTVLIWLKSWDFDTSRYRKLDPNKPTLKSQTDIVIKMYGDGMSQNDIGRELGYSGSEVCKILQRNNIKARPIAKYTVDEHFFDMVDHEYKAYILGWLYSDGSINNEGKIRIALKEQDKHILEWMKKILTYTGPLYYKKARNSSRSQWELCINRKSLADRIIELGCHPNKALSLQFPYEDILPKNLISAFVRGYFEGDGSVQKNYVNIVGSLDFIYGLVSEIPCNLTGVYQRYKDRDPKDSSHQLFICHPKECIKFLKWIYPEDHAIHLDRKFASAQKYFLT